LVVVDARSAAVMRTQLRLDSVADLIDPLCTKPLKFDYDTTVKNSAPECFLDTSHVNAEPLRRVL
jgi:hypothetical protein